MSNFAHDLVTSSFINGTAAWFMSLESQEFASLSGASRTQNTPADCSRDWFKRSAKGARLEEGYMAMNSSNEVEIMSVDEARQIMPVATNDMSDSEVAQLIERFALLAGAVIETVQNQNIIQSKHSI